MPIQNRKRPGIMLTIFSIASAALPIAATICWKMDSTLGWQDLPLSPFGGSLRSSEISPGFILTWHSSDAVSSTVLSIPPSHFARVALGFCYIERYQLNNVGDRIVMDRWFTVPYPICAALTAILPLIAI